MSISNFGSDMTMDGKDLYKKIDIDPEKIYKTAKNKRIIHSNNIGITFTLSPTKSI